MYPWDAFSPPDPRANWLNYDDSGRYLGPPVAGELDPYVAGTLGNSGYDTSGPPPQPAYIPESSSQYLYPSPGPPPQPAYDPLSSAHITPPATAPATSTTDSQSYGAGPATAPTTSAPAPAAPVTEPATTPATAPASPPLASGFGGGEGDVLPAYGSAAAASTSEWGERASRPPATAPKGTVNRWDNPIFFRYFQTLGASQPGRVALIRGLPDSALSARPRGFASQPQRRPLTRPRTMPTGFTPASPPRGDAIDTAPPPATAPGGSAASRAALAAALQMQSASYAPRRRTRRGS